MSATGTTVTIDGMKFTFSSDENNDKTIRIAEYVDSKISEIRKGNNKLNPVNLYTLVLMNVTGELFEKESKYNTLVEESKEPIQRFQTISKEVDKITKEKTELENSLSKLKSDLIESLNKIGEMNAKISSLEEENKKKKYFTRKQVSTNNWIKYKS